MAKRLKLAAEPNREGSNSVAGTSRILKSRPLFTTVTSRKPSPAQGEPSGASKAEHDKPGSACQELCRQEPTSVCVCCNGRFHTEPCDKRVGQDKRFCARCWRVRRERCRRLLQASGMQLARWAHLCSLPMLVREVEGRAVCAGFQLGICRDSQCPEAHVCHGCGRSHMNGAICLGARRTLSKWRAQLGKQ